MRDFRFKKISIIPQYALNALNPINRIDKMVQELLRSRGLKYHKFESIIKKRLNFVELDENVLKQFPFELSAGMKQRIVLVLSTLLNPSLLIADEITSALDIPNQKAVIAMLKHFWDMKIVNSIIFISHDISLLYQIVETVIVMYAGKLVEQADVETIVTGGSLHPYTQMLIKSLPQIGIRYHERVVHGISGSPPSLLTPPQGCRFISRCSEPCERCKHEEPPFEELYPKHFVACWKRKIRSD
jgi:peptide/nickel transport system ATP-binding protein